jgi:hypothetical protein
MSEMKKRLMIDQSRAELYFFRDHSGLEVDGVIDHAGELFGFEIKSGQTLTEDFFANLVKWQKITKAPRENLALFYGGDDQRNVGGIQTFPWKKVDSWPAF